MARQCCSSNIATSQYIAKQRYKASGTTVPITQQHEFCWGSPATNSLA